MNHPIIKGTLFIAVLILAVGVSTLWAEDDRPTASAEIGVFNKYVWRGWELSDDSIVVQPSVTASYKGFSMNLWGNIDTALDDRDPITKDQSVWNETDFTLSYDRTVGFVDLGFGYIYYGLDGLEDTGEVYGSATLGSILFSPTLTVYRDIHAIPGWYLNLGLSYLIDLPKNATLDLSGSLGYYISDDPGFVEVDSSFNTTTKKYRNPHDGVIRAVLTIPVDKYVTIAPMLAYSFPLSHEADNLLTSTSFSGDSDYLYGGVSLSMSF